MTTTLATGSRRRRAPLRHPLVQPAAVGILAFVISVIAIGVPSIWYDESATIVSATRSWSQLWAELHTVDAVHGLYYAGMHVVFDLFGYSPFTLRLPSALGVGIAAAFTVVLGRQLGRASLGLVAGIVFALLPRTVWAGGEGRSYALTAAAAVVLTVVFVAATRSPRRRLWIAYAAIGVASGILFSYLALVVLAHGLAAAAIAARRGNRRIGVRWVVAAASVTVVLLPFARVALGQKGQIEWLARQPFDVFADVFVDQWFMSVTVAIVGWLLIVVGAITALRSRRFDERAAVLLPIVVLPTAVLLVASSTAFPVYTPRYLTMCLPFVALLIAVAIDAVPWRPARALALVVVAALAVPQLVLLRLPEAKENSAWAQVAARVGAEKSANTAIIYGDVYLHPLATARVVAYAYPKDFAGTTDVTLRVPAAQTGALWDETRPLAASLSRLDGQNTVFLVTSTSRNQRPVVTATLARVGWHEVHHWHFTWMNVVEYRR